ncbi:MAG TPA: response regulator [Candidatus Binatia bacterium]|nr:response regulator [Candidatus Binatia bacterium]
MSEDPYRYFRVEARDLLEGLSRGVLDLEKGVHDADLVAQLLRLAHTLKGAARVVKQPAIAEAAHHVEEALAPHRGARGPLPRSWAEHVLRHLDDIATGLAALDRPAEDGAPAAGGRVEDAVRTVRVEIADMDEVLDGLAEACGRLGAVREELEALGALWRVAETPADRRGAGGPARRTPPVVDDHQPSLEALQRNLAARLEESHAHLLRVRDAVGRLRLVPAASVFAALHRAVRDAGQSAGRRADFEARGGDVRLDPHVLTALRDALLHVVRNGVVHGIEPEAERLAAGKPAAGRVEVQVTRRGDRVAFVCRDDGRGIDVDAVRRAAVERGMLSGPESSTLAAAEVVRLILHGGVTTTETVTQVSGRGIGLDVLRETVARLKGDVTVSTEAGIGTTVEVSVPVSLSVLPALAVDAAGVALVPLDAVRATRLVTAGDVASSAAGERVVHEGDAIPFVPLAAVLGRPGPPRGDRRPRPAVVVRSGTRLAAFGVDRVLGITDIVVRPLPPLMAAAPVVAAAAIDANGGPQLVLDPAALVTAAAGRLPDAAPAAPPARRPVLVVDDSLTTRMLEQSILESAGYEVDLATSAEEALAKARLRRYGVFVVDVEMPGMDGFEFVARTRADPVLSRVPAILVTSRSSDADRRRGLEAGASAYIVKSDFDQGRLLERIRELVS